MTSITCWEYAWRMHQQQIPISQIAKVINKSDKTIYRWLASIKKCGIREFVRRKRLCKVRRPKARTPEWQAQLIVDIRQEYGWCGAKIKKELEANHNIKKSLATIYRILHERLTHYVVGVKRYEKHQPIIKSYAPREVVEHDTVDLGGGKYAYTSIDVFTKEPCVIIAEDLTMRTGKAAFLLQKAFYGPVGTHQSDNGSEFQKDFVAAVITSKGLNGEKARHRYSRPYKKNEQSHIENFNKSLRAECFPDADYSKESVEELQQRATTYCEFYINRRWHMGLPHMMTPAEFLKLYRQDPEYAKLELTTLQAKRYGKRKILICG